MPNLVQDSSVPPSPGTSVGIGLSLVNGTRAKFDSKARVGRSPGTNI